MVFFKSIAAVLLLLGAASGGLCQAAEPECTFPDEVADIGRPLSGLSGRLDSKRPLKIVALGSSSTAGAGASRPDAAYPSRLQERLSLLLGHQIIVVNRGRTAIASVICCPACPPKLSQKLRQPSFGRWAPMLC